MICRECGGLLHVGLRHECSGGNADELARRLRRAQRARQTYVATGLGDPISAPRCSADLTSHVIITTATVGPALGCQVADCTTHPDRSVAL